MGPSSPRAGCAGAAGGLRCATCWRFEHGNTNAFHGLRHRARHPVHERRRPRRARDYAPRPAPGGGGDALPRPLRHHRREPDARRARTAPRRRARRRGRGRPRAGDGRRRRLRHPRGHPRRRRDGQGRRHRHPLGLALLQQAHPGRPLPALPRDRGEHVAPDHGLQRRRPHRFERRDRDAGQAGGDPEHHRRQGSVGEHRPDLRRPPDAAAAVPGPVRRRRHHAAGHVGRRPGRHLGGRQRDPRRTGADGRSRRAQRLGLLPEVFRLPMVSPSEASRRRIERVLADLELLPAAAGARA